MNLRMSDGYLMEQDTTFKYLSCCPTEEFCTKVVLNCQSGQG